MTKNEWEMTTDEYWVMNDDRWRVYDDCWQINDEEWLMNYKWCLTNTDWQKNDWWTLTLQQWLKNEWWKIKTSMMKATRKDQTRGAKQLKTNMHEGRKDRRKEGRKEGRKEAGWWWKFQLQEWVNFFFRPWLAPRCPVAPPPWHRKVHRLGIALHGDGEMIGD